MPTSVGECVLYAVKPTGDTVTVRNLPSVLATGAADRIKTFVLGQVEYDFMADALAIDLDEPTPSLDFLLARKEAGLR